MHSAVQATTPGLKHQALVFIENKGQIVNQDHMPRTDIRFSLATGNGLNIFFGAGAIHYQFHTRGNGINDNHKLQPGYTGYRMDVELVGANRAANFMPGQVKSYYEHHYTDATGPGGVMVGSYEQLTCKDIYPNIDWVLYTKNGRLKHEFVVRDGGNPGDIKLKYCGATKLEITESGELKATTPLGTITENAPFTYSENGTVIQSHYKLSGDTLSYYMGQHTGMITIDPTLSWATYYGGDSADNFCSISRDTSGNIYASGNTRSLSSIATTGAFQTTLGGFSDIFVVKFNGSGARLWATYTGGSSTESGDGIAVDQWGNAYVCGLTSSTTVISTSGGWQTTPGGSTDGFLQKYNAGGARIWGTYYGGAAYDYASTNGVAVDPSGNVLLAGSAASSSAIASASSWQSAAGGGNDAFLAKFDSSGNRLWGTYYGGTASDGAYCVATDAGGNVYLTGNTMSVSAIASAGAWQPSLGGSGDAFLAKFDAAGTRLWGTYYGGTGQDWADAVTSDPSGEVYVAGRTWSTSAIASAGAFQPTYGGSGDAFLAKFSSAGTSLWGTYYGNTGGDFGNSLTIDPSGNVYMAGFTGSTTGMATVGAYQTTHGGNNDAFLAQFTSAGSRTWGTYFGGTASDQAFSLTSDATGVYMTGLTSSATAISSAGAFATAYAGGAYDGFIAKFSYSSPSTFIECNTSTATPFGVFPNPAKELLHINASEESTVILMNLQGQTVLTANNTNTINVASLPAGIYMLRISSDSGVSVERVMVER
jgi:hypothetical protein